MKKVILIMLVAVLGVATANAQFEQGGKTLSANVTGLDLNMIKVKGADNTAINFGLKAKGSYFVIDNLAVTAGLGFGYQKEGEFNNNSFDFEIGGRYYFYQALYAALAYEGSKAKEVDMASWGKIEVGYDYYITENVFFEPALFFKQGFGGGAKDTSMFGLSIGIGVNF